MRQYVSDVTYIDATKQGSAPRLGRAIAGCMLSCAEKAEKAGKEAGNIYGRNNSGAEIIFLCIGTDMATGDSLGPLVGHKLRAAERRFKDVYVYGNLENPVHAKNIAQFVKTIYNNHYNPFIVAVDACLGIREHIGWVSLGPGALRPGAGVRKTLPSVGDMFITGVVNLCAAGETAMLQNTRLGLVMRMADAVTDGIIRALDDCFS